MNILILDKHRRDTTSLIYHYCKLGHKVFAPKPFSGSIFKWEEHCVWPLLLTWASENSDLTNFEYHRFYEMEEFPYGEDNFLIAEDFIKPVADKDVSIQLVDFEKEKIDIDAFHLTVSAGNDWERYGEFVKRHCPDAKMIHSAFNHFSQDRIGWSQNVVEYLPASYEGLAHRTGIKNFTKFFRHPHEIQVLGIESHKSSIAERHSHNLFVSFNHNFAVRHPDNFKVFEFMKQFFKQHHVELINFGGNIRGQGADLKYSQDAGITGNNTTLSPRESVKMYLKSRGVIHLKGYDWAGGVESDARHTGTPFIITSQYAAETGLSSTFGYEEKSHFCCNNTFDICYHMTRLLDNDYLLRSVQSVEKLNKNIFTDSYWKSWENLISNLV